MRFDPALLDEIRTRLPISQVVGRRLTWDKRKSQPGKGDYWACCPFHGEKTPSFHVDDRRGIYHCFGCGATGDHFRFLTETEGKTFPEAVEDLGHLVGVALPTGKRRQETPEEQAKREAADAKRQDDFRKRQKQREEREVREYERRLDTVEQIWRNAVPIAGTLAERYLNSRGIELSDFPAGSIWMPTLRFHQGLMLPPSEGHIHGGRKHPALIGATQSAERKLIAVWRIFLDEDGKALLDRNGKKIKLGLGPASGGAVRLAPCGPVLRLAEGIETALGVMLLTGCKVPVWATLSTSGMISFQIPAGVRRIEIYADGDRYRFNQINGKVGLPPGIKAAKTLQERAISEGVECVINPSPEPDDWLDVYQSRKKDQNNGRDVVYLG